MDDQQLRAALEQVDEDELADLALALTAIPSPTGEEQAVGEFVAEWLRDQGVHAFTQEVEEGRVNAVGLLPGEGGPSLTFNGHMDTGGPMPPSWPRRASSVSPSSWSLTGRARSCSGPGWTT